jgi:hypothetical protein
MGAPFDGISRTFLLPQAPRPMTLQNRGLFFWHIPPRNPFSPKALDPHNPVLAYPNPLNISYGFKYPHARLKHYNSHTLYIFTFLNIC